MQKLKNYINSKLIEPVSKQYIDNYNPATGKVYSLIPDSDEKDVELAVAAASDAFPAWSVTPKDERSKILINIAHLIEQNFDRLAKAESIDNGKPHWLAKEVDLPRASSNFNFFASAIVHFASESQAV